MNFWVAGNGVASAMASAAISATGGGTGGGGFAMSKDEMESLLTKAEGTLRLIGDQLYKARDIAVIEPPGHDSASVAFTNTAVDAGKHYLGHLQIQQNRYTQLIGKLNDALGKTVATDEHSAHAAQQAGAEGKY
jgi:hypothetical protein